MATLEVPRCISQIEKVSSSMLPATAASLTTIPRECRAIIYKELFKGLMILLTPTDRAKSDTEPFELSTAPGEYPSAITQTCRLLLNEARPYLFANTTLICCAAIPEVKSLDGMLSTAFARHVAKVDLFMLRHRFSDLTAKDIPLESFSSLKCLLIHATGGVLRVTERNIEKVSDVGDDLGQKAVSLVTESPCFKAAGWADVMKQPGRKFSIVVRSMLHIQTIGKKTVLALLELAVDLDTAEIVDADIAPQTVGDDFLAGYLVHHGPRIWVLLKPIAPTTSQTGFPATQTQF